MAGGERQSFLESHGVSPLAAVAFLAIVALAGLFVFLSQPTSQLRAVVLSSGSALTDAMVEVLSPTGTVLATGTAGPAGSVTFTTGLPSSGKVVVRASKEGFVGADGSKYALAVVDISSGQATASVELFSSQVQPGEFNGTITFTVLDDYSQRPISGATLSTSSAGPPTLLETDGGGQAAISVQRGSTVRVKTTAQGYFDDVRAFTAIRGAETILLYPRSGNVSFAGLSGQLPQFSTPAQLRTADSVLQDALPDSSQSFVSPALLQITQADGSPLENGSVSLVSAAGEVVQSAPVWNGAAQLSNLPLEGNFSIEVQGTDSGTLSVIDPKTGVILRTVVLVNGFALLSDSPLGSLLVLVSTPGGTPLSTGSVQAVDSSTQDSLGSFPIAGGRSQLTGITPGTNVTLLLSAQDYSSSPSYAIFGSQPTAALLAVPESTTPLFNSVLAAKAEDGSPVAATVDVFVKASGILFSEQNFSGSTGLQLPQGQYSAVFSSPNRYTVTFDSFSAGDNLSAVLPTQGSQVTESECVSQTCSQQTFSPSQYFSVSINVSSQSGLPVQGASVSLRDGQHRVVFSAKTDSNGQAVADAVGQGSYTLAASAFGSTSSQAISVSGNSSAMLSLNLTATVYASAFAIGGGAVSANFSADGSSCDGTSCALYVEAGKPITVSALADGFLPATSTATLAPNSVLPLSFSLGPASSQLAVSYLGVRDSAGRNVSSLLAGQDYLLLFSLYGSSSQETSLTVKIGDKEGVSDDFAGIVDFIPDAGTLAFKSTSYSPQPTCVDLNNNNPVDGLFKWAQIVFENNGAPVQKTIAVPIRLKSSIPSPTLSIYYRASSTSSSSVSRIPADPDLGNSTDSPSKAGCYASFLSLHLPVAPVAACLDGTPLDTCSFNTPLACSRDSSGSAVLSADAQCCPQGTSLSNGVCVVPSPSAGNCADNTAQGQCSQVNKPFLCTNGQLSPSTSCCSAGEVFEAGVCRPPGASCQVGGTVFSDGQCLPSQPLRCLNGVEKNDALGCGCLSGTPAADGSCALSACSDGTPAGQCSQSPSSQLQKCVLAGGATSPSLSPSSDCSCPSGTSLSSGQCVSCTTPDCASQTTCTYQGVKFSPGCIAGAAPLYCSPSGALSSNPSACGCDSGRQFDSSSGKCVARLSSSCNDGTQSGACSQQQPKECILVGGSAVLADNALLCGCPPGMISNGVGCRLPAPSPQPSASPQPGGATSTPAPLGPKVSLLSPIACSSPNTCLAPDSNDSFCNSFGQVSNNCMQCDRTCGGNGDLFCNPLSGACEARKCLVGGVSVPVDTCASDPHSPDRLKPQRCVAEGSNNVIIQDSGTCGCPSGYKDAGIGESCIPCTKSDCSDANYACTDPAGHGVAKFSCLGEKFSVRTDSFAEPIQRCEGPNTIKDDISICGCPTGYHRDDKNTACVVDAQPSQLPAGAACTNCVSNDTVFFDSTAGELLSRSGSFNYTMVADTVFPADAFHVFLAQPTGATKILIKKIVSSHGAEKCYSFDINSGLLSFHASNEGDACPISVRNDAFYVSNSQITSDLLTLTLTTDSVPPVQAVLDVNLQLSSSGSLQILPQSQSGPGTPQLFYLLSERSDLVPRLFSLQANTQQNAQVDGVGMEALAWRGPGALSISEHGVPVTTLQYQRAPSYFACAAGIGGQQLSSASDWRDCMNGWCTGQAFSQAFGSFKQYSNAIAQQTAFRRGNGEPWKDLMGGAAFKQAMAAQVADGAAGTVSANGISLSGFDVCGNFSSPGVFKIISSTSDGSSFSYSAVPAKLAPFDYIDGSCNNSYTFVPDASSPLPYSRAQFLCRFLYGQCDTTPGGACIGQDAVGNVLTNNQFRPSNSVANQLPLLASMLPLLAQMMHPQQLPNSVNSGNNGGTPGTPSNRNPKIPQQNSNPDQLLSGMPSHLFSPFNAVSNDQASKPPSFSSLGGTSQTDASKNQLKDQSDKLNKAYTDSRPATDKACGPRPAATTSGGSAGSPTTLSGDDQYWIDQKTAHQTQDFPSGACLSLGEACALTSSFDLSNDDIKKLGDVTSQLDACEDMVHGPKQQDTLQKFASQKCMGIQQKLTDTLNNLKGKIQAAQDSCSQKCQAASDSQCLDTGGECSNLGSCKSQCETFANAATDKLSKTLGTPNQIAAIFKKFASSSSVPASGAVGSPGSSSTGTGTPPASGGMQTCAQAVQAELNAGDDCELLNKQLAGDADIKGLLVEPFGPLLRRTAWAVDYAYGNKGGGKCVLVCQKAYSFVMVFSASRKTFAIEKYGLESDCSPIKPKNTANLRLDDANELSKYLANFMPAGGESQANFLTTGYVGDMDVGVKSGSGKFTADYGGQQYDLNLNNPVMDDKGGYTTEALSNAYQAASDYLLTQKGIDLSKYDVNVDFLTGYSEGNSHTSAMATNIVLAAEGYSFPKDTTITGSMYYDEGWQVGPVGGVSSKAYWTNVQGYHNMIVPPGLEGEANGAGLNVYHPETFNELMDRVHSLLGSTGSTNGNKAPFFAAPGYSPVAGFKTPFDPGEGGYTSGAGVLPTLGKLSPDGTTVTPFQLSDIFKAPINGPSPLGQAANKVPDKLSPDDLKKKSQTDLDEVANNKPFLDSFSAAKDPSKLQFNPVNQPSPQDLLADLQGSLTDIPQDLVSQLQNGGSAGQQIANSNDPEQLLQNTINSGQANGPDNQRLVEMVNGVRQGLGLGTVQYDNQLAEQAQGWAQQMANGVGLEHTYSLDRNGNVVYYPGYTPQIEGYAEIIDYNGGFGDAQQKAISDFIGSPPHYSIMTGGYSNVGAGTYTNPNTGLTYTAIMFR